MSTLTCPNCGTDLSDAAEHDYETGEAAYLGRTYVVCPECGAEVEP